MSCVVVLDACVLYPAALRDLLVRLAVAGAFRALWSERILDEAFETWPRIGRDWIRSGCCARER